MLILSSQRSRKKAKMAKSSHIWQAWYQNLSTRNHSYLDTHVHSLIYEGQKEGLTGIK